MIKHFIAILIALTSCCSAVSAQSKQDIRHYLCRDPFISDEFPKLGTRLTIDWTNRRFTFNNYLGWYDGFTIEDEGLAIYWEGDREGIYERWTIDVVEGYITQQNNNNAQITSKVMCLRTAPFWLS